MYGRSSSPILDGQIATWPVVWLLIANGPPLASTYLSQQQQLATTQHAKVGESFTCWHSKFRYSAVWSLRFLTLSWWQLTIVRNSIVDSKFQEGFQIWTAIDQSEISHDQTNLLSSDIKISDPSPKTPYSTRSHWKAARLSYRQGNCSRQVSRFEFQLLS